MEHGTRQVHELTTVYIAVAFPRTLLSSKMSAYTPPMTEVDAEAPTPTKNLKITSDSNVGAKVQPMENAKNKKKLDIIIGLLPYCSLMGENVIGPKT